MARTTNQLVKEFIAEECDRNDGYLKLTVEYSYSSGRYRYDYVEQLRRIEHTAKTYPEYLTFFKEVEKVMSYQCSEACNSIDCAMLLSPVFRIDMYGNCPLQFPRGERPADRYLFAKFPSKFYKRVSGYRSQSQDEMFELVERYCVVVDDSDISEGKPCMGCTTLEDHIDSILDRTDDPDSVVTISESPFLTRFPLWMRPWLLRCEKFLSRE